MAVHGPNRRYTAPDLYTSCVPPDRACIPRKIPDQRLMTDNALTSFAIRRFTNHPFRISPTAGKYRDLNNYLDEFSSEPGQYTNGGVPSGDHKTAALRLRENSPSRSSETSE